DRVANGLLSPARTISTMPNRMVKAARMKGRKPEPGSDRLPNGRSVLMANTSSPKATKKAPAAWSARSVMVFLSLAKRKEGSSLHAADGIDGVFLPLGVGLPELGEFRLVHIGQFLAEIGERVEKFLAVRGLVEAVA